MDILAKIVDYKKQEVKQLKEQLQEVPFRNLSSRNLNRGRLSEKLINSLNISIIAEFKRRSPSKDRIAHANVTASQIVKSYCTHGAAAVSVLSDSKFFGAKKEDFQEAVNVSTIPVLRKDFIIDEIQIMQSKYMGADIILLIAAVLDQSTITRFCEKAHELEMEVLCEIHDQSELNKLNPDIDIIGINNRNLKTFEVNYEHSMRMRDLISAEKPVISESGLSDPKIVAKLYNAGFQGFLIGEHFMKNQDPAKAVSLFLDEANSLLS